MSKRKSAIESTTLPDTATRKKPCPDAVSTSTTTAGTQLMFSVDTYAKQVLFPVISRAIDNLAWSEVLEKLLQPNDTPIKSLILLRELIDATGAQAMTTDELHGKKPFQCDTIHVDQIDLSMHVLSVIGSFHFFFTTLEKSGTVVSLNNGDHFNVLAYKKDGMSWVRFKTTTTL